MTEEISLLGVGDVLIDRPEPTSIFAHVAKVLQTADIAFANCEQMYSDIHDKPISRHPSHSDPENIGALASAGFDVLSLANNHTMDWGGGALVDTLARLRAQGFKTVGAGPDLDEARKPVIMEAKGVKVGFLAYGNTGPEEYAASTESPGYAPVHAWTEYERLDRQAATPQRINSGAKPDELTKMADDIEALKKRCHAVIISFHWGIHFMPRTIPDYCYEVGRAAVDAGADLVLGTHPHILKAALERLHELYGVRPDPEYPTYPMHPEGKMSVIVKAAISARGVERVGCIPVHINRDAEPEIVGQLDPYGQDVIDYLRSITESEELTCAFRWYGDEIVIGA